MLHVVFHNPEIPPNTGNAIRLVACVPAELHLIEPLGFTLEDKQLRRAGLDYHDLARVHVHPTIDDCFDGIADRLPANETLRVNAFTRNASTTYTDVEFGANDVLLFGCESRGLPPEVLQHPRVSRRLSLPMLPGRRSLNLSNSAAIAAYEAWRQLGFAAEL